MGAVGWSWSQFRSTPLSFALMAYAGRFEAEQRVARPVYEAGRMAAWGAIVVNNKKVKPRDIQVFPWEREDIEREERDFVSEVEANIARLKAEGKIQ